MRRLLPVLLVLVATPARAETILFVGSPPALSNASEDALTSWNVDIETIDGPALGAGNTAFVGARELAATHRAKAVIWTTEDKDGASLWVYDATEGVIATRPIEHSLSSLSEAEAAEIALSLKTLLRHSQVAPESERIIEAAPPPPPERSVRITLRLPVGARIRSGRGAGTDVRLGLDASVGILKLVRIHGRVLSGPGLQISTDTLRGRLDDTSVSIGAAVRLFELGDLALRARGGFGLHFTRLSGTLIELGDAASASRVNPELSAAGEAEWKLTNRLALGVLAQSGAILRTQTYLVQGESVVELPRLELYFGVFASVAVY